MLLTVWKHEKWSRQRNSRLFTNISRGFLIPVNRAYLSSNHFKGHYYDMCNIVDSYLRSSGSSNSVCKVTLQLPNIQHIGANILLTRFTNSKTTNPNIQFFAQLEHMWQVLKVLLLLSYLQKQSYSGFIVCLLDFVSKMPLISWWDIWF